MSVDAENPNARKYAYEKKLLQSHLDAPFHQLDASNSINYTNPPGSHPQYNNIYGPVQSAIETTDDFGNKVLTATWARLLETPTFNFCASQSNLRRRRSSKRGQEKGWVMRPPRARRRRKDRLKQKQDFQPDFWRKSGFVPNACHAFQLPFSASLFRGKREASGGGGVLACCRFCDSPNPSIGESSNDDEKARASSFENFPDKRIMQGTGIEAPRSYPEA